MQHRIQPDLADRAQVKLLHILGRRLQDHLVLVIVLQPVGILAIAAIGGPAGGLDIGRVPGPGPQGSQGRGGMESARAHLIVIGLQDQAALPRPIVLQGQNKVLERLGFGHESALGGVVGTYRRPESIASEAPSRSTASAAAV